MKYFRNFLLLSIFSFAALSLPLMNVQAQGQTAPGTGGATTTPQPGRGGVVTSPSSTSGTSSGGSKIEQGLNQVGSQTGLPAYSSVQGDDVGSTANSVVRKIIEVLLIVAASVAMLFIIIGGYYYITSGGNDEQAKKGKKYLTNALIGLVIIILSYAIVRLVTEAFIRWGQ